MRKTYFWGRSKATQKAAFEGCSKAALNSVQHFKTLFVDLKTGNPGNSMKTITPLLYTLLFNQIRLKNSTFVS